MPSDAPAGAVLQPVQPFAFTVTTETGATGPGATIQLDALIPIHLVAGVTAAEATAAIGTAAASFAGGLSGGGTITADGFIAALRDDTRYSIVRADVAVTTETADRFLQLADGIGAQPVAPGDQVVVGTISIDVREGGV